MTKCHQEPAFVWDFKANGATATHTSLSGGKFHVPLERYAQFLKQYASAILAGSQSYLTERVPRGDKRDNNSKDNSKDTGFRMFLDLDFAFNPENTPDARQVLRGITEWMDHYDLRSPVHVATRNVKVHVVFPELIVASPQQAMELVGTLKPFVREWCNKYDEDQATLEKVMDASVYRSGLRMLYAHKTKDHDPEWVTEKRYLPLDNTLAVVEPTGSVEKMVEALENASIFNLKGLPATEFPFLSNKRARATTPAASSTALSESRGARPPGDVEFDDLPEQEQQVLLQGVCEYIRPNEWQDGKGPSVRISDGKPYVLIEGKSKLTCLYTYRSHTSNRQYVKLDEHGITYCCHNDECRKQPVKKKTYAQLDNGAALRKVVTCLLYGRPTTVDEHVAKARQETQDSIFTGSTTGLECNLKTRTCT
ncbi:hypothetical protein HDU79_011972 [Rhizoclosmatium sp. JEL0117]|nr:hypothetical protein HDU79_011972 [Rhizoclosmatium sp. JEL0117]